MKVLCVTSSNFKDEFLPPAPKSGPSPRLSSRAQFQTERWQALFHEVIPITHHVAGPQRSVHLDKAGHPWSHNAFPMTKEPPMG